MNLKDPSGHLACSDAHVAEGDCSDDKQSIGLWRFGIRTQGLTDAQNDAVKQAVWDVGSRIEQETGGNKWDRFREAYGISDNSKFITIKKVDSYDAYVTDEQTGERVLQTFTSGAYTVSSRLIVFASFFSSGSAESIFTLNVHNIVHELGHSYGQLNNQKAYEDLKVYKNELLLNDEKGWITSPKWLWRMHPGSGQAGEVFADQFLGWTYNTFSTDTILGYNRKWYMNNTMSGYLVQP